MVEVGTFIHDLATGKLNQKLSHTTSSYRCNLRVNTAFEALGSFRVQLVATC